MSATLSKATRKALHCVLPETDRPAGVAVQLVGQLELADVIYLTVAKPQ